MNNEFDKNNKYTNEDRDRVLDRILIEEDINYREEFDDHYKNIIDDAVKEINKNNKKRNKKICTVVTCAALFSFTGGFLANNYLNNKDIDSNKNLSYKVDNDKAGEIGTSMSEDVNKEEKVERKEEKTEVKENLSTEEVVKLVSPSVVTITARSQGNMFTQGGEGVGTGFIVDKDGKVVTNYHVIEGASELTLTLHDGREVKAKVISTSKKDDLAILQIIDDIEMPGVATLANDDSVNAGQEVIAIGNPLGKELSGSVTKGIISSPKRIVNMDGIDKEFMQIDAAINPGNSGGPLINLKGEIIGVNTAKRSGENVEGIGFAVPIKYVRDMIASPGNYTNEHNQIENNFNGGYNERYSGNQLPEEYFNDGNGYGENENNNGVRLGIQAVETNAGIVVAGVERGSIAETAGLQTNDIIVGFQGVQLKSVSELKRALNSLQKGQSAELNIQRNGQIISLIITL